MQGRLKEGFEMNRAVYFNSPFLLGFEHLERLLERTAKSRRATAIRPTISNSPAKSNLRITLAVAGFGATNSP